MKFEHILMLLGALTLVLFLSAYMKQTTVENFDGELIDHLQELDKRYTNKKARRYNQVSDGMNDFLQGYLNNEGNNEDQASDLIQGTMSGPAIVGSTRTPSGNLVLGNRSSATHAPKSEIHEKIKFCEALKGDGQDVCEALARPEYSECGVCLKEAIDSKSRPHVGGLFFAQYDRLSQDQLQKDVDPMFRKLRPTVGKCTEIRNFVTTRERCIRRREQLMCEARNALPRLNPDNSNNCSQCVEQGLTFLYRGAKDKEFSAVLHVIAEGEVSVGHRGIQQNAPPGGSGLRYVRFVIERTKENEVLNFSNSGNTSRILAAQWSNLGETRVLPFYESIVDKSKVQINGTTNGVKVTQSIPASERQRFRTGTLTVMPVKLYEGGGRWTTVGYEGNTIKLSAGARIRFGSDSRWVEKVLNSSDAFQATNNYFGNDPAAGTYKRVERFMTDDNFSLQLYVPGFLGEPDYDEETAACPTGGLLGTDLSMRLNKSNPCYTENANAPLSQVCVSNLFLAAGGNVFGQGYPVNQVKTDAILKQISNSNNIDQVMNFFLNKMAVLNTGQDANGNDLPIDVVNGASLYMLGIEVRSPCDINGVAGPLTNACLQYLYDNKGVGKREGATYQESFGSFTSYCTRKGTASPIRADGSVNTQATLNAKNQGGIRAVQSYYSNMHRLANTAANAANAGIVMDALGACYGIVVPQQAAGKTACDLKLIAEYDISKKPVNNTQMLRMSIENNTEFGPMTDVDLILQRNSGSFTFNKNTINVVQYGGNPGATLTIQCRKARAVNFWIRCDRSQPGGNVYLMDLRGDPNSPDSYLWRPNDGAFWPKQSMYINGAKVSQIPWNTLLNNRWYLVSMIFEKPFNGPMSIFSRYTGGEGLACEVGPITLYGDIADPADPKKMVTLTEFDITSFYNTRPEWANIPTVDGYEYKGCWGDSWWRALPFFQGGVGNREQCAARAKSVGHNTFAVQYYGECWTGNYPTHNYEMYGMRGDCPPMGGGWSQQVYYNPDIKPTMNNSRAQAQHSGRCLDIFGFQQNNGTRVIQYDCHGGANQRFDYDKDRKTIKVKHSGKCLTVASADAFQKVVRQDCTGAWNQRWDLEEDGHLTLSGTSMSMDVYGGWTHNIVDIILYPRHGGGNQKFNKIR